MSFQKHTLASLTDYFPKTPKDRFNFLVILKPRKFLLWVGQKKKKKWKQSLQPYQRDKSIALRPKSLLPSECQLILRTELCFVLYAHTRISSSVPFEESPAAWFYLLRQKTDNKVHGNYTGIVRWYFQKFLVMVWACFHRKYDSTNYFNGRGTVTTSKPPKFCSLCKCSDLNIYLQEHFTDC